MHWRMTNMMLSKGDILTSQGISAPFFERSRL